ncbi:APC family permease [Portibacter lacus]|uniref:Amino acid transporter n=1 Tax=Portibacter lacus TaxID=1099794 RepID=A0AA37ST01_9BACT|nr:APC family permease [Portibacter lacus]GLR19054.1 amino acid transporter [Portibacter lacus]
MASTNNEKELKRVVGVTGLSLNIINITVGAGIFALPAIVGVELGAFSVFAYVFCGIMMACIMLCYAEIGTRVTKTGGSYAYVVSAFGDFAGFIVNWLAVFGWSILGSAALMNIIADSLAVIFPIFSNSWIRGLFFFILLAFLAVTNIRGAKQGVAFIKWITIIKLLPLIGIVIFGLSHINGNNLYWEHLPSLNTFGNTTLVLFFAFAGFETALGVSGEIKNPKRTIPLGILLGGGVVIILYLLLQTVTQGVLGSQMELVKDAPLAAVAERIIGSFGGSLLLIAAAISCFGAVSTDILNTPRVLFAGAKDGLFPKFLAEIHPKFATPNWSIICFSVLIFLFSISGGFQQLAILASAAILLIYLLVVLATIKLRMKKRDDTENTFKVPGGLVIPVIAVVSIVWLLTSLSKWEILSTVIFIAVISATYLFMKWMQNRKSKA